MPPTIDPADIRAAPPPPRRRRWVWMALLAAALLAGGWSGWWLWLQSEVHRTIDDWSARAAAAGRVATVAERRITGFPGVLRIELAGIVYADPDAGWRAALPGLQAHMAPWRIGALNGTLNGPLDVDVARGPRAGTYRISAGANTVSADADGGGRTRLSLQALRAETLPAGPAIDIADLTLGLARAGSGVAFELDAAGIDLPKDPPLALGSHVARLQSRVDVLGPLPGPAPLPVWLEAWRKDGGRAEIRALNMDYGPLGLAGEGTAALDEQLQPEAAFSARLTGFAEAIDAFIAAGLVRPRDGALAKAMLGFLAKAPAGGGPAELSVPLTLQEGTLSVGPIPLIRMPPVRWE